MDSQESNSVITDIITEKKHKKEKRSGRHSRTPMVSGTPIISGTPIGTTGNILKLNVGGTVFQTTRSTLTKYDCMFRTMLESGIPSQTDESGCIFIDRDPKHFRLILNFMRDSEVQLPRDPREIQEILKEAQFYLLEGLISLCQNPNDILILRDPTELLEVITRADKDVLVYKVTTSQGMIDHPYDISEFKEFVQKYRDKCQVVMMMNNNGCWTQWRPDFYPLKHKKDRYSKTDESGCIFIDRDPKHFRLILNFMRDSEVQLPADPREIQEILKEAQFYLLEELINLCGTSIEPKLIRPDYHVIKDTEELLDFVMKAGKDVLVILFPNKDRTLYHFNQKILQKFIEKHKETVEIVFCRKENSQSMTWQFNYYRLESELSGIYTQNEQMLLQDVKKMIRRLETVREAPFS